jgi:hypothetical protein
VNALAEAPGAKLAGELRALAEADAQRTPMDALL